MNTTTTAMVAMVVEEPTACDEEGLDSLTTSAAEMEYGMTIEAREPNEGDHGTEQSQEYEPRQDRKRQRKDNPESSVKISGGQKNFLAVSVDARLDLSHFRSGFVRSAVVDCACIVLA